MLTGLVRWFDKTRLESDFRGNLKSLHVSNLKLKAIKRDLDELHTSNTNHTAIPSDPEPPTMTGLSEHEYMGIGSGPGYDRGRVLVVNDSSSTTNRDMVEAAFDILDQEAIVYVFTDLPKTKFKATAKAIFDLIGHGYLKTCRLGVGTTATFSFWERKD
jgi:hypothetical protein